ncbi:uncharacterized protein [Linepithema humile]|uniref:uncharacterized protein n=1 Tax=Linepithema humile TaxID=83485 RepID=UPI00351E94E7
MSYGDHLQNHQGSASCTSFYLFFSSTFLFTMAGTLLSTGVWCFLVRLPMIHLAHGPSRIIVVLSGYIFAAGALTLPTSCILYREHNVTRGRRRILLPIIIMLCLSIVFLICGATHGIIYRKSYHPFFQASATAQARLQCCGINEASDWTGYSALAEPPSSCYSTSLDENGRKIVWKTGCLDAIISDLAWITAYIVGLCFMSILANILAIVSAGILLRIAERTSVFSG